MNSLTLDNAAHLGLSLAAAADFAQGLATRERRLEQRLASQARELEQARAALGVAADERERLAARLASLLEALPGGVVVLDQHGCIQCANPVARDLLGPLVPGESWSAVVQRAFAPRWDDGHDLSLADGRRVNLATQALVGEPGQILLLQDVTETRRLQEQLAHHKRLSAQTEMAAALAHQIRTPLAAALLSMGTVERAGSASVRERAVQRSIKVLRRLERVVDEMLLFARGGRLDVVELDVPTFLAGLATATTEANVRPDYAIVFAAAPDGGTVHVNVDALHSIVLNLVENACEAAAGRGRIEVSARVLNGRLQIRFADDGPGIPAAHAERVFEPFFTTRGNGTGLGLAVARAVARAHGGDLALAAAPQGCCLLLSLPLAQPSPADCLPPSAAEEA